MALDDYLESEVAVAVAATAAIMSPRARKLLRRGAVYGLAGMLMAGDALSSAARNVAPGVQQAAASAASVAEEAAERARTATESAEDAQALRIRQAATSAAGTVQNVAQRAAASAASVVEEAAKRARTATESAEDAQAPGSET